MKEELQCWIPGQKPGFYWIRLGHEWSTDFILEKEWKFIDSVLYMKVRYEHYTFVRKGFQKTFLGIPYKVDGWTKVETIDWFPESSFRIVIKYKCDE